MRIVILATMLVASSAFAQATVPGSTCTVFPANHIFNTRIDSLPAADDSKTGYISSLGNAPVRMDLGTDDDPTEDYTDFTYYGIPFNIVDSSTIAPVPIGFTGKSSSPDESNCPISPNGTAYDWRDMSVPCVTGGGTPLTNAVLPIDTLVKVEGGYRSPAVQQDTNPSDIDNDNAGYSDAHMLLVDTATCFLWEGYYTNYTSGGSPAWAFGSIAMWDLSSTDLRPASWTSADAAGFPIYPLLAKYDEAHSGTINHALRFTAQQNGKNVWPATHSATNGGTLPDGLLIRLKKSYTIASGASTELTAILTAMKQYGMYMADGGTDMYVQGDPNPGWPDDVPGSSGHPTADDFEVVDISSILNAPGFSATSAAVPPGAASGASSGGSTGSASGNTSGSATGVASGTASGAGVAGGSTGDAAATTAGATADGTQKGCNATPVSGALVLLSVLWIFARRRRG